ncbi:MAG: tRNA (N6-isopentenyl adenosine(37)-C2)-methylthiotransferase MiaB [Lachnospiraceae bacterium]|nr:tRNA (N6-isopentenyl adenosine(37)-C2)-methylthiotransferase MiaB [Lachnospiraceae bacterium]MCI9133065.1 tRNA (N6-isopentenyl adenosine(37)-C2)-methylthiotransferase MiaB [Lachnospiraceae bacterium]
MYKEMNLDLIDVNAEPPIEEPSRQYYFMAKCRQWVRDFEQKSGRLPKACIVNMGCQMNARDSEKLTGILEQMGYAPTEEEQADFVIYNTCTVRENANLKVYGRLGKVHHYKKENPHMRIALCGCMMQEEQVVEKLKSSYSFVDIIFGTHNVYKLAELLFLRNETGSQVVDVWKEARGIVEELPSQRKFFFKSGVNISFGCNNFCSYCIVPYVRGRERSRKPEDILEEIERLAREGVVEIMLLGQNVNSYGKDLKEPITFARLLRQVEQIPGIERIRFMTSHPKDLSEELIQAMKESPKVCRHLHLPVQSGSTAVLKAMNRRYTKEQYLALVDMLRREIPDISLTTDIIVGFPGETEEDFQETLDVVRRARYDSAFTFLYSRRTGTPAAVMENQVPPEVMKERFDRLLEQVQRVGREMSGRFVGTVQKVLVEEVNVRDDSLVTGRLDSNLLVHFPGDDSLIGKLVRVRLEESRGFYYMGSRVLGEEDKG